MVEFRLEIGSSFPASDSANVQVGWTAEVAQSEGKEVDDRIGDGTGEEVADV